MHFQPRRLICQHGIGGGVALVEAIACEFVDQVEQFIGAVGWNLMRCAAGHKTLTLIVHFLLDLLAHRATQQICFTEAVARQYLRGLHHLFLIDENPVGFVQTPVRANGADIQCFPRHSSADRTSGYCP